MDGGVLSWLLFYLLLGLFCLPGYLAARGFHSPSASRLFCLAAGSVYSLGALAVVAWPCLWFRVRAELFWSIAAPYWAATTLAAFVIRTRLARRGDSAAGESELAEIDHLEPDASGPSPMLTGAVVVGYLVCGGALAARIAGRLNPQEPSPDVDVACFGLWCATGLLAIPIFRTLRLRCVASPEEGPSRLWTVAAVAAVAVLTIGAGLGARPDWDDTWYLSAVHRYSEGGALNREGFTLPGEEVVPPHMRLLAWELLGATFCRFSGVHPMISHHTLLPSLLVLWAAVVHWHLLAQLLSRRLAPLAIIGLGTYWLFGVSAYDSPGSYLLTRPWQGKTMLWSVGLPLLATVLLDYFARPRARTWIPCFLASLGALAMSSSAVYLVAACLPLLYAAAVAAELARWEWRRFAAICALALPEAAYGLLVRFAAQGYSALTDKPYGSSWQQSLHWGCIEYGASELLWLLAVPLLIGCLRTRKAFAYLVLLPLLLAATFLNPLAYEWVAAHLTSYHTYFRLFWLIPFGSGIGCTMALVSDGLVKIWNAPGTMFRSWPQLLLTLSMATGLAVLPGRFAWSPGNEGPFPGLRFVWGENAYKIPNDLLPIVREAQEEVIGSRGRLLLPEHLAQFFVPYSSGFRCVSSRPTHTVEALAAAGRADEALERVMLVNRLLRTTGTEYLVRQTDHSALDDGEARRLVDKYQVTAVVVDNCPPSVASQLADCGFARSLRRGDYEFWRRPPTQRRGTGQAP